MLQTVRAELSKDYPKFEVLFVDYLMEQKELDIRYELDYMKRHNNVDVLNLNLWISTYLNKGFEI